MKLIVGLGNPGFKYEKTRHNVGFMVVDRECQMSPLRQGFAGQAKLKSDIAILENGTILIKPQTYMNLSGEAVAAVKNFYKVPTSDIWVVHDDVDLELGRIKIQTGGGSAGHNGLNSVIESLGNSDFVRFRVGVGRPQNPNISIEDYVLQNFDDEEEKIMKEVLEKTVLAIETGLTKGIEKAMNEFN